MQLEVTIERIGGLDSPQPDRWTGPYPRQFGPWLVDVSQSAYDRCEIRARDTAATWLELVFQGWEPAGEDWLGCQLALEDMSGYLIGRRPALLYARPYDVPTYTSIKAAHPDNGLFSVGLRQVSR